jgi:hypothetical protein
MALTVKQQVAPLQATEVANIRRKLASFEVRQHEFREEFRRLAAFQYSCINPYEEMDKVSSALQFQIGFQNLHFMAGTYHNIFCRFGDLVLGSSDET